MPQTSFESNKKLEKGRKGFWPRMNYEWIAKTNNQLEKNPIQKIEKNCRNQSEIAAGEHKPLARKRIFVQTPFYHSTLK